MRLLLSWSRVEPQPGLYDDAYLDEIAAAVRVLATHGIYSIIDLHQDAWGPTLAARPGEVCPARQEPASVGTAHRPGRRSTAARRAAFRRHPRVQPSGAGRLRRVLDDAAGPGGVGIRTRYARMLAHVAECFAAIDAVAGYDLMNEPNAFSAAEQQDSPPSTRMRSPRSAPAKQRRGAPHLVFFEPGALWSDIPSGAPPPFAHDRDVVFAPHIYRGGFRAGPIERRLRAAAPTPRPSAARPSSSASGEAVPTGRGSGGRILPRPSGAAGRFPLLRHALDLARVVRRSAQGRRRARRSRPVRLGRIRGRLPTNEVTGLRQALVDQLTRAYVRSAPGPLTETRYDPATAFVASGAGANAHAQVVAWYPTRLHTPASSRRSGSTSVRVRAARGGVYLSRERRAQRGCSLSPEERPR